MWLTNLELLFASDSNGTLALARRRADLTTDRTLLAKAPDAVTPTSVTPDGKTVVVMTFQGGGTFVASVSLEKPESPTLLFGKSYTSMNAVLSPDGHWIAYEAREGERSEIFVRPFPNVNDRRFQISQGGGVWPAWTRKGNELLYLAGGGAQGQRPLMSVTVKTASGTAFDWNPPVRLMDMQPYVRSTPRGYDVSPDGSRFIVPTDATPTLISSRTSMRFVTNWFAELRERVK
jgi:Tol biopolymer transport system component